MVWSRRVILLSILLGGTFFGITGCQGIYILKMGAGQARIILAREPIAEVLEDPGTDPAVKRKLRLILKVRDYAGERFGLETEDQYLYYYDTGGHPIVYTVTACSKDSLDAYLWDFPIIGEVGYKGYFAEEEAEEERQRLEDEGYDTTLGYAQAYSTLGWFSDPVFTSMIRQDDVEVVATVIHELCHATLYVRDDTAFNESMATFVGFAGALEYLEESHGEGSREVRVSRALLEERKAFSRIIIDLKEALEALYAEEISFEEKMERREKLFADSQVRVKGKEFRTGEFDFYADLEMNNAVFLSLLFYNTRIEFFEEVFREQGGDLRRTFSHFRTATEDLVARWKAQDQGAPRDPEADVPVSGQ